MKNVLTLILISVFSVAHAQTDLTEEILQTWDKHVAMNALLLKNIESQYLRDTSASGGRNVGEQFAHMHNVRMMWLGSQEGIDGELDAKESLDSGYLLSVLRKSDDLIRTSLQRSLVENKSIGEMSAIRFMGYLIAHESHSRGQIMLALKQSSHSLPPNIAFDIWEW